MAKLFIDVLYNNRQKNRFELHEFVAMPDHVHLLLTPNFEISLEKAVQYIKGGFSFRAKKELGFNGEIWQEGFTLRRIENSLDYERHRSAESGEARIVFFSRRVSVFFGVSRVRAGSSSARAKARNQESGWFTGLKAGASTGRELKLPTLSLRPSPPWRATLRAFPPFAA